MKANITIEEVRAAKAELERKLNLAINEFEAATGVRPTDIDVERTLFISAPRPVVTALAVRIEV